MVTIIIPLLNFVHMLIIMGYMAYSFNEPQINCEIY